MGKWPKCGRPSRSWFRSSTTRNPLAVNKGVAQEDQPHTYSSPRSDYPRAQLLVLAPQPLKFRALAVRQAGRPECLDVCHLVECHSGDLVGIARCADGCSHGPQRSWQGKDRRVGQRGSCCRRPSRGRAPSRRNGTARDAPRSGCTRYPCCGRPSCRRADRCSCGGRPSRGRGRSCRSRSCRNGVARGAPQSSCTRCNSLCRFS